MASSTFFSSIFFAFSPIFNKFSLFFIKYSICSDIIFSFKSLSKIILAAPAFAKTFALYSWWFSVAYGRGINIAGFPNFGNFCYC